MSMSEYCNCTIIMVTFQLIVYSYYKLDAHVSKKKILEKFIFIATKINAKLIDPINTNTTQTLLLACVIMVQDF